VFVENIYFISYTTNIGENLRIKVSDNSSLNTKDNPENLGPIPAGPLNFLFVTTSRIKLSLINMSNGTVSWVAYSASRANSRPLKSVQVLPRFRMCGSLTQECANFYLIKF
jgi:hypothetical protein